MIADLAPSRRWREQLRYCWRVIAGAVVGLWVGMALCLVLLAADPFGLTGIRKVYAGDPVRDLAGDVQLMVTTVRWVLVTSVVVGALLACWRRWPR